MKDFSKHSPDLSFKNRLQALRERSKTPWHPKREPSGTRDVSFSYTRVGVEFVSGVIAGVLLGIGIDMLFDIAPWGIISFFILGSCAGFFNIYRLIKSTS